MMSGKPSPFKSAMDTSSAAPASSPSARVTSVHWSGSSEPNASRMWPSATPSYSVSDSWTDTMSSCPSRSRSAISRPSLPAIATPPVARSSTMCSRHETYWPSAALACVGVSATVRNPASGESVQAVRQRPRIANGMAACNRLCIWALAIGPYAAARTLSRSRSQPAVRWTGFSRLRPAYSLKCPSGRIRPRGVP